MARTFRKTRLFGIVTLVFLLASCTGEAGPVGARGPAGPAGPEGQAGSCTVTDNGDGTKTIACDDGSSVTVSDGENVDPATLEEIQAQLDKLSQTQPESCVVCHEGVGAEHQAVYDRYVDASTLGLTIDDVTSVPDGSGGFLATMTFSITKDGAPYVDVDGLPGLEQKRFTGVQYVSGHFENEVAFADPMTTATPGQYSVTASGLTYAPEASDALVYGYVAVDRIDTPTGGRVRLYDDVASAGLTYGAAGTYESAAVVSGCEKCHGAPYGKHGYRVAVVEGLPDFASCKGCHADDLEGEHWDWQILVDDPARYPEVHAGAELTAEELARYAYDASVMNDTHMSHAMEFPYPQSMSNCVVCHEGKLDLILTDAHFTAETCKSCHPVTGSEAYGTSEQALLTLMPAGHDLEMACGSCHSAGGGATTFRQLHSGYDKQIYTEAGVEFADLFSVSIDSASFDSTTNLLNITFSASEAPGSTLALQPADVVPTLLVGLYGYDTRDLLVGPHNRDDNDVRLLEVELDGTTTHPRFNVVSAANGAWEVDADLSTWAALIGDSVRRVEIAVMPGLIDGDGLELAVDAVSRTFSLTGNDFADDFYPEVADVNKCNDCHGALGTTFHSPDRGGSIRVCSMCHIASRRSSHLEMQSASMDAYAHAAHTFQAFDTDEIDFTDPVEKVRYELHVEHTHPVFTTTNCESCHNPGTYEVPDQSSALPGVLSASYDLDRKIGAVPQVVVGPATRACGGCHRAEAVTQDDAAGLAILTAHTKANGYRVEDEPGVWEALVQTFMAIFD